MAGFASRLKRLFGGGPPKEETAPKVRVDLQIVKSSAWEQDVDWIVVPMDNQGPSRIMAIEGRGRAVAKIAPPTEARLAEAYRTVLQAAHANGIRSVAFPPLWTWIPDYDEKTTLKVALDSVAGFLNDAPSTTLERVVFAIV